MLKEQSKKMRTYRMLGIAVASALIVSAGCSGGSADRGAATGAGVAEGRNVTSAGIDERGSVRNAGIAADAKKLKKLQKWAKKERKQIEEDQGMWAVPFDELDWSKYQGVLSADDYAVIEKFLPVLTENKKLTWIDEEESDDDIGWQHVKKEVSLRGILEENESRNSPPDEMVVDYGYRLYDFALIDLFHTGSKDLVLYIKYLQEGKIVLHEEGGEVYALLFGRRSLWGLQKDGTFGEGKYGAYCQMTFADGDYDCTTLAEREFLTGTKEGEESWKYTIGTKEVSEKKFEEWEEEHMSEKTEVKHYPAMRKDEAVDAYSRWENNIFWMREPVSSLPVSKPSVTTEKYGIELPSVEEIVKELKFQTYMEYVLGDGEKNTEVLFFMSEDEEISIGSFRYPVEVYYTESEAEDRDLKKSSDTDIKKKSVTIYCVLTRDKSEEVQNKEDETDSKTQDLAESEARCAKMIYGENGFELSIERIPMADFSQMKLQEIGEGELVAEDEEADRFVPELTEE